MKIIEKDSLKINMVTTTRISHRYTTYVGHIHDIV